MQYRSEKDILDAYGWGLITEKQYDRYLALFREGEDHAPTDVSKGPEGRNTSWDHVQLDMPTADLKNYDNGGQIIKSRTQTRRFAYFNHK